MCSLLWRSSFTDWTIYIVQIYPMPFIHSLVDEHLGLSEGLLVCSKRTPQTRSLTKNKSFLMGQEAWCPGSRWHRQRSWEAAFLLYLYEGKNSVSLNSRWARKGHSALPVSLVSSGERHHQDPVLALRSKVNLSQNNTKILEETNSIHCRLSQHSGYCV